VKITKQAPSLRNRLHRRLDAPPRTQFHPRGYLPETSYDLSSNFGTESGLRDCIAVLRGERHDRR
jgi:hypothetical protein